MILSYLAILFPGGRMRKGCFLMKTRNVSTYLNHDSSLRHVEVHALGQSNSVVFVDLSLYKKRIFKIYLTQFQRVHLHIINPFFAALAKTIAIIL